MNVNSLLNKGQAGQEHTGSDALRGSPDPSESAVTTATTAVQSPGQTPSPEKTLSLSRATRSRSPKGNRVPWEGDGNHFSLPMNPAVETYSIPLTSTAGSGLYNNESPIDHPLRQQSPKSPKHKFSDSRGSQSSYYPSSSASSSAPHSRISSVSTAGGDIPYWPFNTQEAMYPAAAATQKENSPMLFNMDDSQRLSPTPVQASYDALPRAVDTGQTDTGYEEAAQADTGYEEAGQADSGHDDTESAETGESGNEHTDAADDNAEQTDADRAGSGDTEVRDTDSEGLDAGEQHDCGQTGNGQTGRNDSATLAGSPALASIQQSGRATSPSDFLIRRNPGSSNAGSPSSSSPLELQHNYASLTSFCRGSQGTAGLRAHRRAVSAPDFPAASAPAALLTYSSRDAAAQCGNGAPTTATGSNYRLGTIHEPSTAESLAEASHTDHDLTNNVQPAGSVLDKNKPVEIDLNAEPRCMFTENCGTGSTLRKAISHIFGRNKICTRQIPDNVWVHYCRKHYQRTRYRNVQEYAKLQCELVIKQILRVQAWSDINEATKQSGVINSWSLAVRKREQRRMMENKDNGAAGSKRPYPGNHPEEFRFNGVEAEEDPDENYKSANAVPPWLLEKCDHSYSTKQVLEIFGRIYEEIKKNVMRQIPDIEVLPSISHDPGAELHYKPYQKRKVDHKRTQSDTGAGPWYGMPPAGNQPFTAGRTPGFWSRLQASEAFQHEKRQRLTGSDYLQHQPHRNPLPQRNEGRTVPTPWPSGLSAHLPAPNPQRVRLSSTAQQLEAITQSSFGDVERPVHQRSHSDVSSFQPRPPMFADSSVPRFTPVNTEHLPAPNYPPSINRYEQQNPLGQAAGSNTGLNGQWTQQNAYGGLSDSQSTQIQSFGAMRGTQRASYGGHAYGSETSGQLSYANYPPSQQHPSFTPFTSGFGSGRMSYYWPNPTPAPMANSQGHVRHQSSPAIGQLTQQPFGPQQSHAPGAAPRGEGDAEKGDA